MKLCKCQHLNRLGCITKYVDNFIYIWYDFVLCLNFVFLLKEFGSLLVRRAGEKNYLNVIWRIFWFGVLYFCWEKIKINTCKKVNKNVSLICRHKKLKRFYLCARQTYSELCARQSYFWNGRLMWGWYLQRCLRIFEFGINWKLMLK